MGTPKPYQENGGIKINVGERNSAYYDKDVTFICFLPVCLPYNIFRICWFILKRDDWDFLVIQLAKNMCPEISIKLQNVNIRKPLNELNIAVNNGNLIFTLSELFYFVKLNIFLCLLFES